MKIYLLNPPFIKNYVRSSRCTWIPVAGSNWYPIFLGYATGLLEKSGHKVKLLDALVDRISHDKVIEGIKEFKPDLIVIYTSLDSLDNEINLAQKIKQDIKSKIVFVGPWCYQDSKGILEKEKAIDGVIRREFEFPLLKITQGYPWQEIKEMTWRKENGEIIENPEGEFISSKDLDKLPFVTDVYRRHLNLKNYWQSSLKHPFVDLFTARGCAWGKCTFCLWPQTIQKGAPYRTRSIDNVIEELKFIKKEIPEVKEIFFQDDMLPKRRMREISLAILKNNLKITWSGYAKADLDKETLKLAKKSGLRFLHIGYESASDEILKNVNKGETREKMEKFTQEAKKAGIKIHGDFIIGLPGETKETVLKTIKWAKNLGISDYQFVVPQPHPATLFYLWLKESGFLTKEGKVNYPHLSDKELEYWRFYAYRKIYLSPKYLTSQVLKSLVYPQEFFRLLKVGLRGLPKIFKYI